MPSPIRFTRIVATLGPATETPEAIAALIDAGCDVIRLNASHGTAEWRTRTLEHVRSAAREAGRHVAVLLDLAGPKVRVADLSADPLDLADGDEVIVTREAALADRPSFATTYAPIVDDCRPGERILLDDGAMALAVRDASGDRLVCEVTSGGRLHMRKGINLPDTDIQVPALTEKDLVDLAWGAEHGVDFVGLSFVRRAEDLDDLRRRLRAAGSDAWIVAKIEKPEAVHSIKAIIRATDAIMVARGDLGVEMDVAEVPLWQKRIIRHAVAARRPVIVATQMLQTMIEAPQPTRAEVSDVANSILDGTDAVMLSGETAVGHYPRRSVAIMDRIANLTEDHALEFGNGPFAGAMGPALRKAEQAAATGHREEPPTPPSARPSVPTGRALADGSLVTGRDIGAAAIVVLTHSGATALEVSNRRPDVPIIAISDREDACRRTALFRGVLAIHEPEPISQSDLRSRIAALVAERKWVEPGSLVVIISGQFPGKSGTSDMLLVCRIGED